MTKNISEDTYPLPENYPTYTSRKKISNFTSKENGDYLKGDINNLDKIIDKINIILKELNYNSLKEKEQQIIFDFIKNNLYNRFSQQHLIKKNNYKNKPFREKIFLINDYFNGKQKYTFFSIKILRFLEPRDLRSLAKKIGTKFSYTKYKEFAPNNLYTIASFRIKY